MPETVWYLKRCDLFERLTVPEAERLNRRALVRTFKRNSIVYSPTEPGLSVMVLASGRVKIKDITPDGRESILGFVEEGEIFGELALLDGQPRQDYAQTVAESEILVIPRDDFVWLMENRSDIALSITKLIGLRRQRIENRLRNLLFLSSRDRVVRILLELVETHGKVRGNRAEILLPLSHQDLAGLIGVSRETATIALGQLQSDGLIEIQRRRIAIREIARMRQLADGVIEFEPSLPAERLVRPRPL